MREQTNGQRHDKSLSMPCSEQSPLRRWWVPCKCKLIIKDTRAWCSPWCSTRDKKNPQVTLWSNTRSLTTEYFQTLVSSWWYRSGNSDMISLLSGERNDQKQNSHKSTSRSPWLVHLEAASWCCQHWSLGHDVNPLLIKGVSRTPGTSIRRHMALFKVQPPHFPICRLTQRHEV